MAHDNDPEKEKNEEEERLLNKLINAYGSYSNVGMAKYHAREAAKLNLSGKAYAVIDNYLGSCRKSAGEIADKLHMSVESMKKLYRSAVETLVEYRDDERQRQEEEFYSVSSLFRREYSFYL